MRLLRCYSRLLPVIPAKAGIHSVADSVIVDRHLAFNNRERVMSTRSNGGRYLVRIRIYGIIGFSGFRRLVFDRQALIRIRLGGISGYSEKRKLGELKS